MNYKLLHCIVIIALLLQGCKKENDLVEAVNLVYQLEVDTEVVTFPVPFEKANVVLVNKTNNEKYSTQATANGTATFETITPGTYAINVSLVIPAAEVTRLSGIPTEEDFHLNYSADNLVYYSTTKAAIPLVSSKPLGGFVIKQVYYGGSHTTRGAGVRDVFYEIYNNSNGVLYADSLCFGIVYGKTNNNTGEYLQPNLQFDWSKSLNMSAVGNPNTDYVYAKAIFMIPSNGRGDAHPIQPGQSIVVAGTAIDHTKPYTLNSDKVQDIQDATLTVDLSKADFEVYLYPYEQKIQPGRAKFASDIDNPSVPDVEVLFAHGMRDLVFNPQGKDSYVLFKAPATDDPNLFPRYAEPTDRILSDKTVLYPQIPVKYIVDAVEVSSVIEKDKTPRRLPLPFDAGSTSVVGGPYSSQSIVRKTKKNNAGRRILEDTNNSAYDFGYLSKANPSKGSTSFID